MQLAPANTAPAPQKQGFRPDIQGLRAVSVLLVLLYHSGVESLSGGYIGVDVFFVISGFLITTHLLESLEASGKISFSAFYARRARRILPAALTVAGLTVLAAWLWMPPLLMEEVRNDALATALYLPNIFFALQGTNYLAEDTPSVFQHYWSLGIEEQFYLIWPGLLALGYWISRRSERCLFLVVLITTLLSFLCSVILTSISQPWAFFSLPTRGWELGCGGLIAFLIRGKPVWMHSSFARPLQWIGLALLTVLAISFNSSVLFPSWTAALPVLAALLIIVGGVGRSSLGAGALLSLPPLQFLGKISYSLYLVHWPLQVIPEVSTFSDQPLPQWQRLLLGLLAIPLAWCIYRCIELPTQRWSPQRQRPNLWTGALAATMSVLLIVLSGIVYSRSSAEVLASERSAPQTQVHKYPLGSPFVPANLTPSLRSASGDNAEVYSNGCHRSVSDDSASGCKVGKNDEAPLVFLFGDSHAASWYPALKRLAEQGTIRLDSNTKSSCYSLDLRLVHNGNPYASCDNWRDGVIERINIEQPDLVILANYNNKNPPLADQSKDVSLQWQQGLESTLSRIVGPEVAIMRDVPDHLHSPPLCLSDNLDFSEICATDRSVAFQSALVEVERNAASNAGAHHVDMTRYLCNEVDCPPIIGNTLAYRDSHHLTASFSRLMSEELWSKLAPLVVRPEDG